jgi:hypothetical protein
MLSQVLMSRPLLIVIALVLTIEAIVLGLGTTDGDSHTFLWFLFLVGSGVAAPFLSKQQAAASLGRFILVLTAVLMVPAAVGAFCECQDEVDC